MEKVKKDSSYKKLVSELSEASRQQKLVIFVGAGVSISQGYPNWNNYVKHLIRYWQGQVLSEGEKRGLGREHHLIFDSISNSDISNKRKVDLVNYELKNILGEDFEKKRLDFEKGYFKSLLPYSQVNPILQALASLNAIFITSNYDYEIENHAKRLKNTVVRINDLNEFRNIKDGNLRLGDVLHIHGTPDCDDRYFVSSSADYSKVYLRNRGNFDALIKWFKETKPTVLFIGASLEEDEILSLLHEGSRNYALLKAEQTANPKVDEHYKIIVEEFFSSENHTQIIWYGDTFDDLPIFVDEMVSDINEELGLHEFHSKWNHLLDPSVKQEEYNKYLDDISNDLNYLDSLIKKVIENKDAALDILLLNGILQGKTIKKIGSTSFPVFWKFIVENIDKLAENEWNAIYDVLLRGEQNCFMEDMYTVYNRAVQDNIFEIDRLYKLREVLSKDNDIINSSFNHDSTLLGYWFVNTFENEHDYLYIENEDKIEINFNSECIERLGNKLSESQHFRYYSISELLKEGGNIELFYKLIKSNSLSVDGKEFMIDIPEKLLNTRLVQKLLVQIDNEDGLNSDLVNRLIDHIDFTDALFGEELNKFVEKHREIIKTNDIAISGKPYKSMIYSMEGGFVSQFSFLTKEELAECNEAKLVDILINAPTEQRRSSFLEEETIPATEDFLISVLKESTELSKKVSNLLISHVQKLLQKYRRLYVEIAISDEITEKIRDVAKNEYLKRFNDKSFDYNDEKFFSYFIKQQNNDKLILEKLISINPNDLSTSLDDNIQLDMFHFINSELGSYIQCLVPLFNNHSEYQTQIIQRVESIDDSAYKEIAQGIFLNEYNDVKELNITYYTFLGFAYFHSTMTPESANIFSDVIAQLLSEKIGDNQILNRVYMIALECIDPTEGEFELSKNNYGVMLNTIFTSEYEFKYSKQWLQALFRNKSNVNYLETISNLFHRYNIHESRLSSFIEELKNFVVNYEFKLSPHRLKHVINKEDTKYFSLVKKYFLILLEKDKLENDFFYLETIRDILPLLSVEERMLVLQNIRKQKNCSPTDIEEIQNIISDLNL